MTAQPDESERGMGTDQNLAGTNVDYGEMEECELPKETSSLFCLHKETSLGYNPPSQHVRISMKPPRGRGGL